MCIFIAYMSCSSKCKDSKIQSRFREMGVLDIQAGVAMLYFSMKQTCEIVFVIDRIGGSFWVLSYSSHRFHEKERYEERDQKPMSTEVGERIGGRYEERDQGPMSTVVGERTNVNCSRRKNWGSIRHLPPPHPPLIDTFLSLYKNCLPCGNNTIL